MNALSWLGRQLDAGWFSRILVLAQFWFVYWLIDWSMALGSTAVAAGRDLLGTAAIIGAVGAIPQALLMLATKGYMDMRAAQPRVIEDRRAAA